MWELQQTWLYWLKMELMETELEAEISQLFSQH